MSYKDQQTKLFERIDFSELHSTKKKKDSNATGLGDKDKDNNDIEEKRISLETVLANAKRSREKFSIYKLSGDMQLGTEDERDRLLNNGVAVPDKFYQIVSQNLTIQG